MKNKDTYSMRHIMMHHDIETNYVVNLIIINELNCETREDAEL